MDARSNIAEVWWESNPNRTQLIYPDRLRIEAVLLTAEGVGITEALCGRLVNGQLFKVRLHGRQERAYREAAKASRCPTRRAKAH